MTASNAPTLEGRWLGRYRLRHRIGEGGMAAVYVAQLAGDRGFERWVAVKVIHPQLAEERRFVDMLFDEARTTARIHHPNVASVLDFGEDNDLVYLVMEYLEGETLSAVLRRAWQSAKGCPYWLAARTVADAARGLHAAHELLDPTGRSLGVVHRDVSPQNMLVLYDGHTKVLDFGIAKARGRLAQTRAGEIKGKIAYLAPEQLFGEDVDRRADVWALGVVLWEATVGRRLFRGENAAETAHRVVEAKLPAPHTERAEYPRELERIVLGALDRDRGGRIPTAGAFADALESFLYSGGRPAGVAQVAEHMKRHFDDRLAVRRALLSTSDDSGSIVIADLKSEGSLGSHLIGFHRKRPGEQSGARPRPDLASPGSNPSAVSAIEEELDLEIKKLKRTRRRRVVVGFVFLLLLAAVVALAIRPDLVPFELFRRLR